MGEREAGRSAAPVVVVAASKQRRRRALRDFAELGEKRAFDEASREYFVRKQFGHSEVFAAGEEAKPPLQGIDDGVLFRGFREVDRALQHKKVA